MSITCIIPFFNERDRILKVLDGAVKIKGLYEILLIDDGSTDGTAQLVRKHYPKLTVISSFKNQGKTEAVALGLKKAKGTFILLLDADLQDLQYKGIENAISAIKKDKTIDMIILRRTKIPVGIKVRFYDVLLCGQRIVKKDDLLKTLSLYRPKSYQLEFALNQYMLDKHKHVYWMPLSFKNTWSTKKMGVIQGTYKILDMHIDIIAYIGLYNAIRQVLFFGKREYRD